MNINTLVSCPDCGQQCTMYVKKQSRTLRIECPSCGITDYVPEYDERVVID